MTARRGACLLSLVALAAGCSKGHRARPAVAWVVVATAEGEDTGADALDRLRVSPPGASLGVVRSGPRAVVDVDADGGNDLRVEVPGSCPVLVGRSEIAAGATVRRRLVPRVALKAPPHAHDLGYGAPFALEATLGCGEAAGGSFTWRQVAGSPLLDVRALGARFEARTALAAPDDVARRPERGIVPVSARSAGEVEVEVTWRPATGEPAIRRATTLAAASRSHGLPNVAVDSGVLLSGGGWTLQHAPPGARTTLRAERDLTTLLPDRAGEWVVRDDAGRTLSIHAGRYDETPLDCGRAPCHAAIASASQASPMTRALDALPPAARPCATGCHATGSTGADDGGFAALARDLGVYVGEVPWAQWPAALRRVGGVTCLGCHGPGAIPEPSGRWAVLRTDVCATCHDAPPTYGHVAAWRSSRMARSDASPATRAAPECARCHTTSGFLASLAARPDVRSAPPEAGPVGIACPACHAPHDDHGPGEGPLLRSVPSPAWANAVETGASALCLSCHSPITPDPTRVPAASAANLWAGRGGVDPQTGTALSMPAVHGSLAGGCLGCHDGGPPGLERGRGHAFRADPSACRRCHDTEAFDTASLDDDVQRDARTLLARLEQRAHPRDPKATPSHASPTRLSDDALGRATYDVLLVLEDPAAAAHNEPFARALLAAARTVSP